MAIQTAIFIKKLGFDTQIVAFLALNRENLIHKRSGCTTNNARYRERP